MNLLLIRHGRPVTLHGAQGQPDPELSVLGHEQAEAVADFLGEETIDEIWTSPLHRAAQTAAPLARRRGLVPRVDRDLVEMTFGERSYVALDSRGPGVPGQRAVEERFRAVIATHAGRQTLKEFRTRVDGVTERIVRANPGRTVAVVCHGGVINAVLAAVLGLDAPMPFPVDYASVSRVLVSRAGHAQVASINEHAHVRALDLRGSA